jgi:Peptidase M60, enhancin and enhancin-like/N-terminal domain of M60-like peptidases
MVLFAKNFAALFLCSCLSVFAAQAQCAFELSGRPEASAAADGVLLARATANATGAALTNGTNATRAAADIAAKIATNALRWDVNGSGGFDRFDAAIISRYLAGFRGNALIPGGAGAGATRTNAADIDDYIANGCPIPGQPVKLAGALIDPTTRTTTVDVFPISPTYRDQRKSNFPWTDYRTTGTYAQPGESISIAVGAVPAGTTVEALIGVWSQGTGVGTWNIYPVVIPLVANATTAVSAPNGGPVYVRATNPVKGGSVRFQIVSGGTAMPLFLLGRDNHAQFLAALNAPTATPYLEMVSHRAIVTFKTDKVKAALALDPTNAARMAVLFDRLLASHDSVSGLDNSSAVDAQDDHPLHYTSHADPTYYFFAFIYRTAFAENFANVLFTKTFVSEEPGWGVWHETGHMYQGAWEWADLSEVSVNIYSLEFGKKIGAPNRLTFYDYDAAVSGVKIWDRALQVRPTVITFESLDVFQKLVMFWQLRLAYGPNFYGNLHKFYRNPATRPALPDDASRRQQFIVAASRVAGQDLRAYFNAWGLTATAATDAQVSALALPAVNVNALLALRPQ